MRLIMWRQCTWVMYLTNCSYHTQWIQSEICQLITSTSENSKTTMMWWICVKNCRLSAIESPPPETINYLEALAKKNGLWSLKHAESARTEHVCHNCLAHKTIVGWTSLMISNKKLRNGTVFIIWFFVLQPCQLFRQVRRNNLFTLCSLVSLQY